MAQEPKKPEEKQPDEQPEEFGVGMTSEGTLDIIPEDEFEAWKEQRDAREAEARDADNIEDLDDYDKVFEEKDGKQP